jgi:hypothetical protein
MSKEQGRLLRSKGASSDPSPFRKPFRSGFKPAARAVRGEWEVGSAPAAALGLAHSKAYAVPFSGAGPLGEGLDQWPSL